VTDTRVKINFETVPCGRCDGTGHHQFNQVTGTVCFACSGAKVRLSARGKRASDAYDAALADTAASVAPKDLKPGMRIWSRARHETSPLATYKAAWRTVASSEVSAVFPNGKGIDDDGRPCDVEVTHYSITFTDGRHWSASHSEDPAYWRKGAHHNVDTCRAFDVSGEEASAVRRQVMREITERFTGAWLEGEEPPAPPAPRFRKAADVEKPKALPENIYPGDCHKCGNAVGAKEGERLKMDGRWAVQHKDGECAAPAAAEGPQEAPSPAEEAKPARPAMPNKFGGSCADCSAWVEEGKGERVNVGGKWITRHPGGQCPAAEEEAPAEPVTEEGLYRHDGTLYRVQEGPSRRLYARRIVRPEEGGRLRFERAPRMVLRISATERLSVEEAAVIGREWETCLQCGVELTDPKSIARGIGPDCAKKV
jgi:hypothetical protein